MNTITNSLDSALFKIVDGVITFDIASTMELSGILALYYDMDFNFLSTSSTEPGGIQIEATRKF